MAVDDEMEEYMIGDRVRDLIDNERATVLYVGLVPPTTGVWLGVNWDSNERGKHDGCNPKDGKRYFTASGPKSGSFVRPRKVTKGIDILECLNQRYGLISDTNAGIDMKALENLKRGMNAPFIELVGFDQVNQQQADFSKLRAIDLSKTDLRGPTISASCELKNVIDLDISQTLVPSWKTCSEMCKNLVRLKVLTVSSNPWKLSSSDNEKANMLSALSESLPLLEELVIGKMNYDWKDVILIAGSLPNLRMLQAPSNRITNIINTGQSLNALTDLNLSNNPIEEWSDILRLSPLLPNLSILSLNECMISNIRFPEDTEAKWFSSLTMLELSSCRIDNWASIEALNVLNSLVHFKVKDNPILEKENKETCRQLIIAAMKSIKYLNGSLIEKQERRGAEIDFLKKYGKEYLMVQGNAASSEYQKFVVNHPRYVELVEELGAPTEEELKVKDTSLTSSLLPINVRCPNDPNFKEVVRKLPPGLTIQKLKLLLQRIVKHKAHQLQLSYISMKDPDHEVHLDNDMRDIFFYSISNGDTILVRW